MDRSIFVSRLGSTPPLHELPSIPSLNVSTTFVPGEQSFEFGPQDTSSAGPLRQQSSSPTLTSPARRHVEGVYDRFLMATSGVKRVGKGYQNDAMMHSMPSVKTYKKPTRLFSNGRRPMPPPVSSEDIGSTLMDEHGHLLVTARDSLEEDTGRALFAVKKAFKTIVSGKVVPKR